MKKFFTGLWITLLSVPVFAGCSPIGSKSASMTIIYAVAALLSLLLLIGYFCVVRRRNVWFVLLFSSVMVVNIGYFCLAVSTSLGEALLANRIAYLGSVLLPVSMYLIIRNVTNTGYRKWLPYVLIGISAAVLFVAGSPGYLDIYYKEVSLQVVNGVSSLVKVYGPLHFLYLLYLVGYFAAMVFTVIRAIIKKSIDTTAHAIILAIAVFVNLGVWFIEQLVQIDFEFLSVSYIISELFLLGAHLVMNENQRLKELVRQHQEDVTVQPAPAVCTPSAQPVSDSRTEQFLQGLNTLTQKERALYEAYIAGQTTKDIMAALNIKENTLKFHNKNLYSKLGISSRKELIAIHNRLHTSVK